MTDVIMSTELKPESQEAQRVLKRINISQSDGMEEPYILTLSQTLT